MQNNAKLLDLMSQYCGSLLSHMHWVLLFTLAALQELIEDAGTLFAASQLNCRAMIGARKDWTFADPRVRVSLAKAAVWASCTRLSLLAAMAARVSEAVRILKSAAADVAPNVRKVPETAYSRHFATSNEAILYFTCRQAY